MNLRKRRKKAHRRVMRWWRLETSGKREKLPSVQDCALAESWQARRWE